jgi:hypothetical protein
LDSGTGPGRLVRSRDPFRPAVFKRISELRLIPLLFPAGLDRLEDERLRGPCFGKMGLSGASSLLELRLENMAILSRTLRLLGSSVAGVTGSNNFLLSSKLQARVAIFFFGGTGGGEGSGNSFGGSEVGKGGGEPPGLDGSVENGFFGFPCLTNFSSDQQLLGNSSPSGGSLENVGGGNWW